MMLGSNKAYYVIEAYVAGYDPQRQELWFDVPECETYTTKVEDMDTANRLLHQLCSTGSLDLTAYPMAE